MVRKSRLSAGVLFAAVLVAGSAVMPASAQAVTTIDGPIGLGSAEPFAVLAGSTITVASNPTTTVVGDVGLSPGSSLTGDAFLTLTGTQHLADPVAAQAKLDLTTAYNTAASLTPATSGLSDLTGLSLVPGVYSGGALSLSGELTLAGSASSVWVFQAASTFTAGSSALVTLTGGASICNVFWQVGSSATLGAGSQLVGTIMADQSITAVTGAVVEGRLLARTGAVTLDTNTITRPVGCASSGGTVTTSPTITSGAPPEGTVGVAYSHTIESTGTPTVTYALSAGAVPPGLSLDSSTGVLSGTPTSEGTYGFTATAANGASPDDSVGYTVVIAVPAAPAVDPADEAGVADGSLMASSGADVAGMTLVAGGVMVVGVALLTWARRTRRHETRV